MSKTLVQYDWQCHPKAESFVLDVLEQCCMHNHFIHQLQHDLLKHTSTRLFDWLDHVIVGHSPQAERDLEDSGFEPLHAAPSYRVFHHPGAQLPMVVVRDHAPSVLGIAICVESIADFLMVRGMQAEMEGGPFGGYRRAIVSNEEGISLWVVERRGTRILEPTYHEPTYLEKYIAASEKWMTRQRDLENENLAMSKTLALAEELVNMVGQDLAAWIVLECERRYWQFRNTAGQIQKNRQDGLGMGWANHDHHTFRSSRHRFSQLVRLFEILGFHCRERFYAGKEAGWGAQVMENTNCRLVTFLDVDLADEEIDYDFAHHTLPELEQLGTIGLWCALHGDSILKSGMHHLEAQFMFDELKTDLNHHGVGMMEPFSNFPYLRQAFTVGEVWPVPEKKVYQLRDQGFITDEQADLFLKYGAVGSHMENLQRREGYKGFNQKNVSLIIKRTDPRVLR